MYQSLSAKRATTSLGCSDTTDQWRSIFNARRIAARVCAGVPVAAIGRGSTSGLVLHPAAATASDTTKSRRKARLQKVEVGTGAFSAYWPGGGAATGGSAELARAIAISVEISSERSCTRLL